MKRETFIDRLGGATRIKEHQQIPHSCPVCGGCGQVHAAFYSDPLISSGSTTGGRTQCRTCNGRGIVWEPNS